MQRAAAEAKSKRENIGLDRMAPAFPLPPVGDEQEAALMGELQLRQHVSGGRSGERGGAHAFMPLCVSGANETELPDIASDYAGGLACVQGGPSVVL